MIQTDFLVIGSGIAGLSLALKLNAHGQVLLITKDRIDECNTRYAQGGIAAVTRMPDTFEKHVRDTLVAGDGLCNERVVERVVEQGPGCIEELVAHGVNFDKNNVGRYNLALEGGHSERRVLHNKDNTGYEIERALLDSVRAGNNIQALEYHYAIDLVVEPDTDTNIRTCSGVYALNIRTGNVITIRSGVTVIATGGGGNVYAATTNPAVATGDGIAMAYRAGAKIRDMEFVQFHPTALYREKSNSLFLISEAIRGAGAILRNLYGEAFMTLYDNRGDLAPRDIVARAIENEIKKSSSKYVYLDATCIPYPQLRNEFPNIYETCLDAGIDMSKDMIPVTPAAHYFCGGILVDEDGCSTIQNLYACGECASTGMHGANRLASNSLLEAAVYAHRICSRIVHQRPGKRPGKLPRIWNENQQAEIVDSAWLSSARLRLQKIMSDNVGIVRTDKSLLYAQSELETLFISIQSAFRRSPLSTTLLEMRNLVDVAQLVVTSALLRKESRGLHYNSDYPYRVSPANTILMLNDTLKMHIN